MYRTKKLIIFWLTANSIERNNKIEAIEYCARACVCVSIWNLKTMSVYKLWQRTVSIAWGPNDKKYSQFITCTLYNKILRWKKSNYVRDHVLLCFIYFLFCFLRLSTSKFENKNNLFSHFSNTRFMDEIFLTENGWRHKINYLLRWIPMDSNGFQSLITSILFVMLVITYNNIHTITIRKTFIHSFIQLMFYALKTVCMRCHVNYYLK